MEMIDVYVRIIAKSIIKHADQRCTAQIISCNYIMHTKRHYKVTDITLLCISV